VPVAAAKGDAADDDAASNGLGTISDGDACIFAGMPCKVQGGGKSRAGNMGLGEHLLVVEVEAAEVMEAKAGVAEAEAGALVIEAAEPAGGWKRMLEEAGVVTGVVPPGAPLTSLEVTRSSPPQRAGAPDSGGGGPLSEQRSTKPNPSVWSESSAP
jgi:hypothetical protein